MYIKTAILLILVTFLQSYGADSTGADFSTSTDSLSAKNPTLALVVSLIYPGVGQLYNGKYMKSLVLAGFQTYNFYQFAYYRDLWVAVEKTREAVIDTSSLDNWNKLTQDERRALIHQNTGKRIEINTWRVREKRNKYAWWILGTYIYAMLDAYVDAHLYNFDRITGVSYQFLFNREWFQVVVSFPVYNFR